MINAALLNKDEAIDGFNLNYYLTYNYGSQFLAFLFTPLKYYVQLKYSWCDEGFVLLGKMHTIVTKQYRDTEGLFKMAR